MSSAWLGSAERQDNFSADNSLPSGWYRVTMSSYTGSGFDRGHNCPSADRTGFIEDNSATFLMTNMMPQGPPTTTSARR
ncbi:DNA/RNA non-specific endonuclease [Hymenobacter sp. GOD-10R]|uniref:DNA/RNA non-specific endonuclease n=1 Tax=Hymenobacter sp. GOD-10R TaxID=3093922 RepID=UPI002D793D55|nr:DNA/RNA non-specific endonuclease [Hymenobacter sp. GOD-10R]WRQ31342.1 DNA/RNA non-specific endonuclease [Hymenobacter sp. GOD-10R]